MTKIKQTQITSQRLLEYKYLLKIIINRYKLIKWH